MRCCAFFLFDKLFRVFDVFDGSIVMGVSNHRHLPPLRCCVQNFGCAFGSCYASVRALEVSSFALTTEFVLCVCVCVFFLLLHGLRASELEVFWISIQ